MKKTYMTPVLDVKHVQAETMIAASITSIAGDTNDLEFGLDDAPEEADVKENYFGETLFE
jgi:hypothetical protein